MICRIIFLLFLSTITYGQNFQPAIFQGLGNAGLALESMYSISNNPAGISRLTNVQVGLAYQPHFLSSEIRTQAFYASLPLARNTNAGIGFINYGIEGVSSLQSARLAYAKNFGNFLSSSISVNYHRFAVKNYFSYQTYSFDLGLQILLSETVKFGFCAKNITQNTFEKDVDQYIPADLGIGFVYQISQEVCVLSDTFYEWNNNWNQRVGLCYSFYPLIDIKAGISLNPNLYTAGIGLHVNDFKIDISSSFHNRLGYSPQIAVMYDF